MAQQPFGFHIGYCSTTTGKILLASLYADSFSVTCNGQTQSVTPTAVGTTGTKPSGINQAGYVSSVTFAGLSAGTIYPVTVIHRGLSLTGAIRTLPTSGDFRILAATCDAHQNGATYQGAYPAMRVAVESSPIYVAGILFPDDDVYCDNLVIDDTTGTGHVAAGAAKTVGGTYTRALPYLNKYGLFSGSEHQQLVTQNEDFLWMLRNVPWWISQGDHLHANNVGWWDGDESPAATQSYTYYSEGVTIWDAFVKPVNPPSIGILDTTADHWGFSIAGEVYIVAPDRNTQANGKRDNPVKLSADATAHAYGNNQIDDILSAWAGVEPFKILASSQCMSYITPPPALTVTSPDVTSAQQPLFDDMNTEYKRLVTNITGIQKLANDASQQFVILTGDYHVPSVIKAENTAGTVAESFVDIRLGSVRGSVRKIDPEGHTWVTGYANDGRTTLWRYRDTAVTTSQQVSGNDGHFAIVDIFTTTTPHERHLSLRGMDGAPKWSGIWKQGVNGNLPVTGKLTATFRTSCF